MTHAIVTSPSGAGALDGKLVLHEQNGKKEVTQNAPITMKEGFLNPGVSLPVKDVKKGTFQSKLAGSVPYEFEVALIEIKEGLELWFRLDAFKLAN